ncbi:MAG: hypothetical protein WC829_14350 [Hyphomicrobium sp.]|jgi:hypothetical protein
MSEAKKAGDYVIYGTGTSTADKVWTIRYRIEAGHYPTDEKGRALVPLRDCSVATIYATDVPANLHNADGRTNRRLITGLIRYAQHSEMGYWLPSGKVHDDGRDYNRDLMPPLPRKVKVTAWAIIDLAGNLCSLRATPPSGVATGLEKCVELTGEYEEPWS